MVIYHAANIDRPGQVGIAEPAVQRFQSIGRSHINVDSVPVLIAVVQAGQGQVKGRVSLAAAEYGVGRLGQHLGGGPEADKSKDTEKITESSTISSSENTLLARSSAFM